jgi:hypothetical protein
MLSEYRRFYNQIFLKWLKETFPNSKFFLNPRLGEAFWEFTPITLSGKPRGKLINCEAQAKAIVIQNNKVYIIDYLTKPDFWKIEKLKEYERLFRKTPRFKEYWNYPIEKVLFTFINHSRIEIKAIANGIKVVRNSWQIPSQPSFFHYSSI